MSPWLNGFGKILLITGGALFLIGLFFIFGPRLPFLGNLPGDFYFEKGNFRLYLPLGTGLLISFGLTLLFNLLSWLLNK